MSAKQITVPLEVYVRLQELASLAAYSYRDNQGSEENSASDKPWDLLSKDGASLLDENGALKPEAAELYFTLLPLIAQEFMEQQQALVDAYRQAPKPAAARAKIRPSNQRLIPLTEVPLENQRIAARIEKEFYCWTSSNRPQAPWFKRARRRTVTAAKSPSTRMKRKATRWCSTP